MLNEGCEVQHPETLKVLEGMELLGQVNLPDETLLEHVKSSIRLPYPQIRPQAPNSERIALVGSGPSLNDTLDELLELLYQGAKLVTVNGSYHWAIEQHLEPKLQIVMDARATNARFLDPALPRCRYVLASQCHPNTWQAVEGRPEVWIFHAAAGSDGPLKELLDTYYLGQWYGVGGGTTVATRAISLLRTLGYVRFDLFGIDSCWFGDQHHAFAQPENEKDRLIQVDMHPADHPDLTKRFTCSPWHLKQIEDFLQLIRVNGSQFVLNVHGQGALAYMLHSCAQAGAVVEGDDEMASVGSSQLQRS